MGDLAGEVVRDAADREVRIGVGHHHRDLDGRVEFAGAQRGGDAGVAAADGDEVHDGSFQGLRGRFVDRGMRQDDAVGRGGDAAGYRSA